MVSAFFGQGAAEGFAKQEALDIQHEQNAISRDRLGLLREELQQKSKESSIRRMLDERARVGKFMEGFSTLMSQNPDLRKPGMVALLQQMNTVYNDLGSHAGITPSNAELGLLQAQASTPAPVKPTSEMINAAAASGKPLPGQPELDPEARGLLREGIRGKPSSTRYQYIGPYVDADGQFIGEAQWDRETGRATMLDGRPIPAGAQPRTEGAMAKNTFSGADFAKLATTVSGEERNMRAIKRYFDNVASTSQGLELIADQLLGQFNTIFGKDVTPVQIKTLIQNGEINRLLGGFRKEVVGGGVMTEQDALRVLAALGGDVGLLRNKKVATDLLRQMFVDKAREYNEVLVPLYNAQLKTANRGNFKSKAAIDISRISSGDTIQAPPPAESAIGASADAPARPRTQAEFDALPKGAFFIDDEGVIKVK